MRSHRGFLHVSYQLLFLCYVHTPAVLLQGIYSYFTCIIIKPQLHTRTKIIPVLGRREAEPGRWEWGRGTDPTANNNSLHFIYSPFHPQLSKTLCRHLIKLPNILM